VLLRLKETVVGTNPADRDLVDRDSEGHGLADRGLDARDLDEVRSDEAARSNDAAGEHDGDNSPVVEEGTEIRWDRQANDVDKADSYDVEAEDMDRHVHNEDEPRSQAEE
jgi:hypothetical protein